MKLQKAALVLIVAVVLMAAGTVVGPIYTKNINSWRFFIEAKADGVTDDSVALNAAISSAITSNTPVIYMPCGQILLNNPINLTNTQSLTLKGCAGIFGGFGELIGLTNATQLMCNTGSVCLDFTGSSSMKIADIELRTKNSYSTPSKVGMLFGRDDALGTGSSDVYCFSQFNILDNVYVYMDASDAVTARGRIGVYNVGAEHFTVHGGYYRGSQGMGFALTNTLSISSPFRTLQTGCPASMTIVTIDDAASFQAAGTFAALEFYGTQLINFNLENIHAINSNGLATYAINFNTTGEGIRDFRITGQLEGFPSSYNTNGNIDSSYIGTVAVSPTSNLFTIGAGVNVTNTTFQMTQEGGTPQTPFSNGSASTFKGVIIYAGTAAGTANISSSGITVTESKVIMPGNAGNAIFATGSKFEIHNDFGMQFVGPSNATTLAINGGLLELTDVTTDLMLGTAGGTAKGAAIGSSAGTSSFFNGITIDGNANKSANGFAGAQANVAVPSWRMMIGSGSSEWCGADASCIGRVAAAGTFTTPTILFKIDNTGIASTLGIKAGASGTTIADTRNLAQFPATLTTTAAASDNIAISGVTSSSKCSLTPTNASAATNVATTYVSAKTTNQITVTHTATASMTYDILCSAQ